MDEHMLLLFLFFLPFVPYIFYDDWGSESVPPRRRRHHCTFSMTTGAASSYPLAADSNYCTFYIFLDERILLRWTLYGHLSADR